MKCIPVCWALELPDNKIDDAFEWFSQMASTMLDEFDQFQKEYTQKRYFAWLQKSSFGNFILEYSENPLTYEQRREFIDKNQSHFVTWCLDWKKKLHSDQFNELKGVRKIISFETSGEKTNRIPQASVLPILPGKLGQAIEVIDQWHRQEKALDEYCQRMGVERWEAWIEELADKHYLVQYHYLKKDFGAFYDEYQDDESDMAKSVHQFGLECCGVDFHKKDDWQHLELLIEKNNPAMQDE